MSEKVYWNSDIETLDRVELDAYQLEKLKETVSRAYEKSDYYRNSFTEVGVKPEDIQSLEDIRKLPFTNKIIERERQEARPLLGDMAAVEEEKVVFISSSSGSTGIPTVSPFTKIDFEEFQDVQSRLFWAMGMRPKDRYVHALNFSLFVGGPDVIGAQNLGALCVWAGTIPSDRLLFILKEYQPTIIWTTPSYAWHLGETAIKNGINPAKDLSIRKIIVAGEPGGSIEATRKAIEELWGAELYDFYGISDIFGACAGMCSERDGLHIAEDHILVEVLDQVTLEPVGEGQRGELVLTTLRKEARPMIRFRTGDIVTYTNAKCKCGRTHKRVHIAGRLDDMFICSGVNVFPSDIEYIIRNFPELTGEYRITLLSENHGTKFDIEIEKNQGCTIENNHLIEKVINAVKSHLGVKPRKVQLLKDGDLPRATHKAKRVLDQRMEGLQCQL